MRHVFILMILLFAALPARAQDDAAIGADGQLVEEVIVPAGAKGRFTAEQAQIFALRKVPGELLETSVRRDGDRYYHQYKILAGDQSIYTVEINALSAEVSTIYINSLSANPVLPMAVVPKETAELAAQTYIAENELGVRKPKILSTTLGVRFQNPVYIVKVKQSGRVYNVVVAAVDGDVISAEQE